MRTSTLLSLGLASLATALPTLETRQSNTTANSTACATGVHIIVARASTEKPGEGIIGAVATQVQQTVPGSDSEAVDYPATLTNYTTSEGLGVSGMTKLIENYAARCPNSKMALMGYSQGAQVIGDVMCGTSEANFNSTPPLNPALSKNIIAIIQMGDPTHIPNLPQDVGNSTKAGIFPRPNTTACAAMEPITKSFCTADDRFCDSGNSIPVHLSYVREFGTQAKDFVVSQAMGNGTRKA
ncbi:carbohydrate esterase family 5 protein [Cadophora sp. DSE1049]|nr:carbohydrate esterase family 5 protein [Cadophora sp. DSE1049]